METTICGHPGCTAGEPCRTWADNDLRAVRVTYKIPIPGLGRSVPEQAHVLLYVGDTDESDIPEILAVKHWSRASLAHLIEDLTITPSLRKVWARPVIQGGWPVPEYTLRDRRTAEHSGLGDWEFLSENNPLDLADAFAVRSGNDFPQRYGH